MSRIKSDDFVYKRGVLVNKSQPTAEELFITKNIGHIKTSESELIDAVRLKVKLLPGCRTRQFVKIPVTVPRITEPIRSTKDVEHFFGLCLRMIYEPVARVDATSDILLCGYIGMLSCFATPAMFLANKLSKELDVTGYTLQWSDMTLEQVSRSFEADKGKLFSLMGVNGSFDTKNLLICGFVVLSIMGENLAELDIKQWHQHRWRAMAETMGIDFPVDRVKSPSEENLKMLHSRLKHRDGLRISLFKTIRQLSEIDSWCKKSFEGVMELLKWSGMQHIRRIIKYMYLKPHFRPFMDSGELAASKYTMNSAFAVLSKIPPENRVYAVLLYPSDVTGSLRWNKEDFIKITTFVNAFEEAERTNRIEIRQGEQEFYKRIKRAARDYLAMVNSIQQLSLN